MRFSLLILFFVSLFIFNYSSHADVVDASGTHWPIPGWRENLVSKKQLRNPQCAQFLKFATHSKKFLTQGLVIIKDGMLQYEWYNSPYKAETPHVQWSVSKTVTGALLGIAVRDGKISLDQYLHEFFPRPEAYEIYQNIKISNLFYLDSGLIWQEGYSGDVRKNPVITMLFGAGRKDMAGYASSRPLIHQGPGYKWNYSTGTPTITMGVLKKIYGDDYDQMPWNNLFNPLGLTNVIFERDHSAVFNGGSSVFATPREMAKIGYLYLHRGNWNGAEILPEEWIEKTFQVSPGYLSEGTVIRNATEDGVYGGSVWLNQKIKKGFNKPYPASPTDMMLALGHFGQMIVVLPSQKMVIARTGYDLEYNSHIDEFVSRALSCFENPNYPVGKNIPSPDYAKNSFSEIYKTLKSSLQTNTLQAAIAKITCSCHFISGLDPKVCIARSSIPFAKYLAKVSIKGNVVYSEQTKIAKLLKKTFSFNSEPVAKAVFDQEHRQYGCMLK